MGCRDCKHLFVHERKDRTTYKCRNKIVNLMEVGFVRWVLGCKEKEKYCVRTKQD